MAGALRRLEAFDPLPTLRHACRYCPEATAGGLDQRLKGRLTA
jgi:hypothetical protein